MLDGNSGESDKPGIEEQYQTAGNTSNLTVEADRKGAGDVIIAAGWSSSRVGMALLRLHSEWDRAEKPQRRAPMSVKQFLSIVPKVVTGTRKGKNKQGEEIDVPIMSPDAEGARRAHAAQRQEFDEWFQSAVQTLLGKIPDMANVREQVTIKALQWRISDPEATATATIRYWLAQRCKSCGGTKWKLIPGTLRQSDKPCPACIGGGYVEPPRGQDGRRLANYMDACVADARGALGRSLSNMRQGRNKVLYKDGGYVIIAAEDGTRSK